MAVFVAPFMVAACGGDQVPPALAGMVRTPTPTVELRGIVDDAGTPVVLTAPDRGLMLVYFGYTSCPDVCPTTLYDLRSALEQVGSRAMEVDLTFVSVDPERDTDEILDGYVQSFVESGDGVRLSDPTVLAEMAERFGASYDRTVADDGTIEVSHSAFLYALDAGGRLLVSWPFGTTRDELARDIDILLDQLEASDA